MLIYINSQQKIPVGAKITIPPMMILFQELIHAVVDIQLDKKQKKKNITYMGIIDEPIHDPLVAEQICNVYIPDKKELYPYHKTGGLTEPDFIEKITDIYSSKDIFLTADLLDQIENFGFSGVWIFDAKQRQIITLKEIDILIIGQHK
tara:strand:- start:8465 stop:8908 length:444 start_codon:yes stop_codon:yes gene_type:complete